MGYVPEHVTQRDGSPSQWFNCWAAVGAWLARGASRGLRRPSPTRFRRWAVKPPKTAGGLLDMARGLGRKGLWKRGRYIQDVPKAKIRERLLEDSGKLYAFETDFEVWPDRDSCSPSFSDQKNAYHSIGVVAGEGTGQNKDKVRVMDPLCGKIKWIGIDGVMASIMRYNAEHGESTGTADLIVLTPPPRNAEIPDAPPDAPDEPDDEPEPPVDTDGLYKDKFNALLGETEALVEKYKESEE